MIFIDIIEVIAAQFLNHKNLINFAALKSYIPHFVAETESVLVYRLTRKTWMETKKNHLVVMSLK